MAAGLFMVLDPVGQLQKSWDVTRKSDLSQIQKALEAYYQDNGSYPVSSTTAPSYRIMNVSGTAVDWGQTTWTPYMAKMPKDPNSAKYYVYYSTGQAYYLYASLDRGSNDPQVCNAGSVCANVPSGVTCGTNAVCNYGVSSSNVSP